MTAMIYCEVGLQKSTSQFKGKYLVQKKYKYWCYCGPKPHPGGYTVLIPWLGDTGCWPGGMLYPGASLTFLGLKKIFFFVYNFFPFSLSFFLSDFIYLTQRGERERAQAGGEAEGEAGSLLSKEPDVGLDPRTLGSRPEPKADA